MSKLESKLLPLTGHSSFSDERTSHEAAQAAARIIAKVVAVPPNSWLAVVGLVRFCEALPLWMRAWALSSVVMSAPGIADLRTCGTVVRTRVNDGP